MHYFAKARLLTFAIAAAGVAVFWLLNLPLPFLLGPMAACLVAALGKVQLKGSGQPGVFMRTILGVAVGTAVTPQLMERLPEMAYSVALVPLLVIIIGLIGYPFFRRYCGFDPATSYYAAMPGGFQDMVIFGEAAGGDVRALSLIHATRVLIIVSLAPLVMSGIYGISLTGDVGIPASELPLHEMALMVVAGVVGWKGGEKIGLFGASILGPLIVSAVFSLTGLIQHRPPAEAIVAAQYFIGMSIGAHYVGVTIGELKKDVLAGVVFCFILAALAVAFTEAVVLLGLAPPVEAFLSFAPGGQAEMAVLAIIVGADLPFVVTHHIVRVLVVIAGAPLVARFTQAKSPQNRE